jgi:hypothetical protein
LGKVEEFVFRLICFLEKQENIKKEQLTEFFLDSGEKKGQKACFTN